MYRRFHNKKNHDEIIEYGKLKINITNRELYKRNNEITLTAKELDLLRILINKPGRVFARENSYETV